MCLKIGWALKLHPSKEEHSTCGPSTVSGFYGFRILHNWSLWWHFNREFTRSYMCPDRHEFGIVNSCWRRSFLFVSFSGTASLDAKSSGRLGARTVAYYLTTTSIAAVIGLVSVLSIQPGRSATKPENIEAIPQLQVSTIDAVFDLFRLFSDSFYFFLQLSWYWLIT